MSDERTGSEIAIVGRAGRFPGAPDLETFWRNLAAGVESITFFPPEELRAAGVAEEILSDPAYVPARGVVAEADAFDAPLFGMSPREARITDPQHRLFLECAWEALEDAGCDPARFAGLVGVFAGSSFSRYMLDVHSDPEVGASVDPFQLTVANDKDYLATRVSYKLGLEGPAFTVQTACSTSLVAVHLACQSLLNGECDLALAGGASVQWPQESGYLWSEGMVLSPEGRTRAFDDRGLGTVPGNGVGIVALRRLEDALAAGDAIRAVIRGSAINNDGSRKVGFTAPRIEGQAKAIRAAQIVAEVDAREISYLEGHGTATPLGDPIEVAALTRAFRVTTKETGFCALGSVKTNIGHLDAAAGIAGLIKTVLALEHRQIPPSLGCEVPNPRIDFAGSPFFVNRELRDWAAEDGEPRRAGVSSFGIGGTNAHAVLEEAPPAEATGPAREHQLLILSAHTEEALDAASERLASHLERHPDLSLPDAAFTLRLGRRELEHRRAVVARDAAGAVAALRGTAVRGLAEEGRAAAFLFPGLGGQHAGLGSGLLAAEPLFRREIETCAEILRPLLGFDPMRLFAPPAGTEAEAEDLLEDIAVSMPILFALEQSLGRLWMSWGVAPRALLGHSLGEYAAACLAGVFSTEDGARIMAARGRLLGELPPGAMLSVPLTEEETAPLLEIPGLWLAAVNGPRTCVLSGTPEAVEEAERRLVAEGRAGRRVRARGAYHSGMIAPLLDAFRAEVAKVRLHEPAIPFLSNVSGTWIRIDQATDPGYWTEHLRVTVRFADGLAELLRDPGIVPVELGPGRTLATLAAERLGGARPALTSLRHPREEAADAVVLYGSLGRLWAEGVPVDWSSFAADEERRRVPLPTYPFERRRYTVARHRLLREAPEPVLTELVPAAEPHEEVLADIADWFHVPVWRQTPPPPEPAELAGPWLVFTPGDGLAEALARKLGERVARVEPGSSFQRLAPGRYTVAPDRAEDYDALLAALAEDGLAPAGIVHAWSLAPLEGGDSLAERLARAETATALGFHSLLALAQATGRRAGSLRLTVLSNGLHRIAGESTAPEKATLLGPVLVIPREIPGAVCRSIDVSLPSPAEEEDLAEDLLAELALSEPSVVAWRGGSRWVPAVEPLRLEIPAEPLARLREGGAYLITGGLGAMGLAFAEAFARRQRVKLALLSRSAPAEAVAVRIRQIEALGSEVLVLRADAADPEAMAAAVAAVRERFGPIRGVLHAAGVLGAGLLQPKTREAADAVLAPKVRGTLILDTLLRDEPLDFLVLCSSVSALSGAMGQVDYCAANAFLDAFAQGRGRPVLSIDWDRWKGEGMAWAAAREVHPLLGVRRNPTPETPERTIFAARLGSASSWVLDEHRLLERPLLPGTAYLEMARAAGEELAGPGPVEISDVLFWTPLVVPAGQEAEVFTVLDRRSDGSLAFQVLSAEEGPAGRRLRRHATGNVRPLAAAAAVAARERAGQVLERLPALQAEPQVVPGADSLAAAFGPRWRCLRGYRSHGDEGLADLALDAAHADDVATYPLHPALLDAATGFASAGQTAGFHLPLSYGTVRVLAPLTPTAWSWARRREAGSATFTADIVVLSPDGEPLVEVEAFTKRQIDPGQGAADLAALESGMPGARDASLVDLSEIPNEPGMLPAQGVEALERILGSRRHLPQVVVSTRLLSRPLNPRPSRLRPLPASEPARASRVTRGDATLEETLRGLWGDVLGVPEVGVHDNFFALGGDSILGLQVVSRAREAGLELAPGQIFEHQTIAELAAALAGRTPAPEPVPAPAEPAPLDFSLAGLDPAGLGRLFEQIAVLDEEEGAVSQNVEDIYPLTPLQEGMLFHTLGEPGTGVYIERLSCELRGGLDPAAFRRAWEETLARHPILRTAFLWQGVDRPMQVVRRTVRLPWQEEDWRELSGAGREERLAAFLDEDLRRGFEVTRPPLMRIALFRVGEAAWRLVWTHHHLLLDGWARVHVLRDVLASYEAVRRGLPLRLEAVRPFRDYVAWLRGQDLKEAEAFWRRTLAGFSAPTPLPFPGGEKTAEQGEIALALTAAETATLQDFARRERVTLNTVVQGAWAVLLARASGEEDLVYGSVVSGRPPSLSGAEAMVGPFINTLPVRARLRPGEPAGAWLRRFQDELAAQRRHEHTPLVQVQAWSEVPRGTPLFETLVVFENHPAGSLGGAGSALEIADPRYDSRAHYPLSLVAVPGESLTLQIKHERQRVDDASAARLLESLRVLLTSLSPELPLAAIPILSPVGRREILARSGVRKEAFETTIHALFAARAAATPDAVAVEHDRVTLTYGELDRRAARLASHLRQRSAGRVVGILNERSPDLIVGLLGILKAGAAYLPLDPAHPAERLEALLEDAGAPLLVTRESLLARLPAWRGRAVLLEDETGEEAEPLSGSPDSLAYVIYTSGSTGTPKGVAVSHRAVLHLLLETDYVRLAADDVVAQVATPAFDAATFEIWAPLLAGARLSILGRYDALHPPELAARLREKGITTLFLTTALFNAMAREAPGAFAGLRHLLFGGEAVDPAAVRWVLEAGRPERLLHVYGPTESTTFSTWQLVSEVPPAASTIPIGGPIAGTRALVLDVWGGLALDGIPGELCLGGAGLARGYLGRPDLTAERFVPDPEEAGARLYRTGDLVRRRPDGSLEFLGRVDHQVKVRGFRIEPGEVEAALREQPAVREVLVAALPDSTAGRRLVAWWVRRDGTGEGEDELRAALRARLPEPMVPSAFVEMDALPLNASGKVDRRRLPLPEEAPRSTELKGGEPRTPIEELLAGIEAAVLGRERVGIHDSFLDLGGHSLLATQVVSRVREACGVDLPLIAIFEEPTVAGLAGRVEALLRAGHGTELPPLEPAPRGTEIPLSFSQERLWFLDQIDPGTPAYNVPLALRLAGQLDVAALAGALETLVARHESLRTRFAPPQTVTGRPVQIVDPESPGFHLALVDLTGLPDEEWSRRVRDLGQEEAARRFHLATGPLLRATLVRRSPQEHVLLLTLHHIVSDGWSLGVLLDDVGRAYAKQPLPPLRIQYPDFAVWQRGWLAGEPLRELVGFWRQELEGAPPRTELPTDRPWPAVQTFRGGTLPLTLPSPLAARLRALARAERVTPFMVLLAGLGALLGRLGGQADLLLGTPVANRTRVETEDLIGFFVNTLVLRLRPAGDLTVRRFLERVRATTLAAYAHQDLPFEKLVEELQPRRDLSLTPFFQVLFALQNAPAVSRELPGLTLEALPVDSGTAKFALTLSLVEGGGEAIAGFLEYNRDLFDDATARRLGGNLQVLLAGLADPAAPRLEDLPLLTPEEIRQLGEWSASPVPIPAQPTLPALFAAQAARTPEATAVLARGERLTYAELARRAGLLAGSLRGLGVGPERPVGLLVERSAALPVAILGILAAGGAYVPLDPAYPRERIAFLLRDSGAGAVVVQEGLEGLLPGDLRLVQVDARGLSEIPGAGVSAELDPRNLAYVIYTSGSTGVPKGVGITHASAAAFVAWAGEAFSAAELAGVLAATSVCFDLSVFELFAPLCHGGTVLLVENALALVDLPDASAVTLINTVPSAITELLRLDALPPGPVTVNLAGEPLQAPLVARLHEQPRVTRVLNLYGPSEDTTYSTGETVDRSGEAPTIGRPVAGARAHVLDAAFRPLPAGSPGELCLGGAGLARGYVHRPALTAERFVPDPFAEAPGARLYRTGDLARWRPDGRLEFLGRADHQVKIRGYRIELGEIEARLIHHPAVREAAVLLLQDRLVAYVSPREGTEVSPQELRAFLREALPEPMVPAEWVFLPALPLTPSGKVDRRALPSPDGARSAVPSESAPPRTELERALAEIWCEALGVPQVGVHDSFFDLGGHSLLLTRVLAPLRARFGAGVTLVDLFRFPTVASLAEHLGRQRETPTYAHTQDRARKRQEAADLQRREAAERRRRVPGREPGR